MNFDKSRYPLLLSKEDKATYIALAEHFQKYQASLMFKLYEMYHSVLEQGGERLLRIRSSNTFGDEFSLDRKETVMLMFLSSDKSTLDEAARKTGKTLVVLHTFAGDLPETVRIPVNAAKVDAVLSSEDNEIRLTGDMLEIKLRANFEAVAAALS